MTLKFVLRSQKRTSVLVTDVGDKNVADNDDDSSVIVTTSVYKKIKNSIKRCHHNKTVAGQRSLQCRMHILIHLFNVPDCSHYDIS